LPFPRLVITEEEPTSLLKDFSTFLQCLAEKPVVLTRVAELLPPEFLFRINQKMTNPDDVSVSSKQRSYKVLHLFYHLALDGKLFQKLAGDKNELFLKASDRLRLYEELKPSEKYFFLLETLWTDVDWEKLEPGFPLPMLEYAYAALKALGGMQPGEEISLKNEQSEEPGLPSLFSSLSNFLLYFSLFGFLEVAQDEEETKRWASKQEFFAKSLTPSSFGVTLGVVLAEAREPVLWNLPMRRIAGELKPQPGSPLPHDNPFWMFKRGLGQRRSRANAKAKMGTFGEPFFLPFVPFFAERELQRTLPRVLSGFVDGTYVFKVSLRGSVWRRIEISADDTLLSLHRAIQDAFDFDDDHLYAFYMDGKRFSRVAFLSPDDEEGPHVNEVKIGELSLYVGQRILYLFDFGDEWHFQVRLEDIHTGGTKPQKPRIAEVKGKAPSQYR